MIDIGHTLLLENLYDTIIKAHSICLDDKLDPRHELLKKHWLALIEMRNNFMYYHLYKENRIND